MAADEKLIDEKASESLAVAPPPPGDAADTGGATADAPMPKVRTAHDATDSAALTKDPANEDAKLDVALDETFPTSDAPSNTQPGRGLDPAPSSGFDAEAEKARMSGKE